MIKFEHVETHGWEHAMRGMRNPLESWGQGDTLSQTVGPNDLDLAMRLSKAGSDHAKYLRMIVVYMDVTAPLYWWKEFDTYKVGTVANSCSTMHTIHKEELTLDDFSYDGSADTLYILERVVEYINECIVAYHDTGDKRFWRSVIQSLPSSYNQKRTVMLNYEVLKNIYHARRSHKLTEWHNFCEMIEELPYSQLITLKEGEPHPKD